MALTVQRFVSAAAVALVLGLLGLLSGSEPVAQSSPNCMVTVQSGQSIQKAMDASPEGAIVCLGEGTWKENIHIKKRVTLRGISREKTTLVPEETGLVIWHTGAVSLERLTVARGSLWNIKIFEAKVTILESQISSAPSGISIWGPADVTIANSELSDNGLGISMYESGSLTITNSQISGNRDGIFIMNLRAVVRPSKVSIIDSQITANRKTGITLFGAKKAKVQAEIKNSLIQGNGTSEECQQEQYWCDGLTVYANSHVRLIRSKILNNADWGVRASVRQCGYYGYEDCFSGQVIFEEMKPSDISGNNTMGNENTMSNPGNHLWNRPDVPDGQVCLP